MTSLLVMIVFLQFLQIPSGVAGPLFYVCIASCVRLLDVLSAG